MMKTISIEDVVDRSTGYFFSPNTMRGFNSRLINPAYLSHPFAYFVISNRDTLLNRPREYDVRCFDMDTGRVIGGSKGKFPTRRAALAEAKRMAEETEYFNRGNRPESDSG